MERLFYPAIFHKAKEGGYFVTFPDIPECMSQGETIEEAYEMAVDALGLSISTMKEAEEVIPKASKISDIKSNKDDVVLVEFNMEDYKRKHSSKAVKKTLSIPEWLNEAAICHNINFSNVLQEALKAKLGISM